MKKEDFEILDIPDEPGVYVFKKGRSILYIGKATSLRDRVRSYFTGKPRSNLIEAMTLEASSIIWFETDSVLEALVLEAHLIKKHQPPFNTKEKDDKSFSYVVITKEDFPLVRVARGTELDRVGKVKKIYGPFTSTAMLKEGLRIIRKLFPYRDAKCKPTGKPCFNYQIGLCPGTCVGDVTKKEYRKTIRNISLFFEGKKKKLLSQLENEMDELARNERFEEAGRIRNIIWSLKHINDVSLMKRENDVPSLSFRIEGYDVAHFGGKGVVGVMTVIEDGEVKKEEYRKFNLSGKGGDTGALREMLSRRLEHAEWIYPSLIVVDGGKAQMNAALRVLSDSGLPIPVVAVVKNDKHKPKELRGDEKSITMYEDDILNVNSEAHRFALQFQKTKRQIV